MELLLSSLTGNKVLGTALRARTFRDNGYVMFAMSSSKHTQCTGLDNTHFSIYEHGFTPTATSMAVNKNL